jgi:hypothetical protein
MRGYARPKGRAKLKNLIWQKGRSDRLFSSD